MGHGYAVLLFHTSSHAIRAEKVLQKAGHECKLMPVPRHLSSDCGVCLRIRAEERELCEAQAGAARVEIAAAHLLE